MSKINETITRYKKENDAFLASIGELVYFYRGAIQYKDALMLSPGERHVLMDVVNKRLEVAYKMTNPVF